MMQMKRAVETVERLDALKKGGFYFSIVFKADSISL